MEVVARVGGCGGSQVLKISRNEVNTPIYRFGKEKVSPENIPATVVAGSGGGGWRY